MRSAAVIECRKALAQWQYRLVLIVCAAAPVVFALALQAQSTVPSDTLFGRLVFESGLALPLLVLGFAGLWGLPVVAAAAGGDMFAAEDRHRTWVAALTRSAGRAEVFAAKTIVACGITTVAVVLLAVSATAAGAIVVGTQPLIDLSGTVLSPSAALVRIAIAWTTVLPPCLAITAAAVFTSIATRSSVAGVALPLVAALALQLAGLADGPPILRVLVPTAAFEAWHGVLSAPPFYGPVVYGTAVNLLCAGALLILARRIFLARDII